jgi:hypothetical protein
VGHLALGGHVRASAAWSILLEVGSLHLLSSHVVRQLGRGLRRQPIEELLDVSKFRRLLGLRSLAPRA